MLFSLIPVLLVLFSFMPGTVKKMISAVIRLGGRLKLVKDTEETTARVLRLLDNYHTSFSVIAKDRLTLLCLLVLSLIYRIALCSMPYFVLKMFGAPVSFFHVFASTIYIYASIALGHLAKKHRVLWAILAYFGITTLESLARGLVISNGLFSRLEAWAEEADWGIIYTNGTWSVTGIGMLAGIIGLLILVYLIMSAVYFIVTKVILTRKLNLE
jgi:hypothetical protein